MRCSEFEAELNHLLDERLPMQLSSDAVIHSTGCDECQELLNGYQALFAVSSTDRSSEGTANSIASTGVVLPPKKHHERGCRDGIRLFDRSSSRNMAGLAAPSLRENSRSRNIPVAFPDTQPSGTSPKKDTATETAAVGRRFESDRQWGLGSILIALVPSAAAVYLLGVGLLSQFPASPSPSDSAPVQMELAVAQVPAVEKNNPLTQTDLAKIDWEKTAHEWDQQWKSLAMHRASACQMPGVQPYFYSVNGAVEALRNNVIRREKPAKSE